MLNSFFLIVCRWSADDTQKYFHVILLCILADTMRKRIFANITKHISYANKYYQVQTFFLRQQYVLVSIIRLRIMCLHPIQ